MRANLGVIEQGVESPRATEVHVAEPEAAPRPVVEARPTRRVAVLVAHGMGQQVRFETVDTVARALGRGAELAGVDLRPTVRMARLGQEVAPRAEVRIGDREVHLYEAYWAPVTEGRVSLRDVFGFLFSAGVDGIRAAWGGHGFERLLFGRWRSFPIGWVTTLRFALALLAIGALYLLGTLVMIATAGASLPFGPLTHVNPARLVLLKRDIALFGFAFLQVVAGVGLGALAPRRGGNRARPGGTAIAMSWTGTVLVYLGLALVVAAGVVGAIDVWPGAHLPPQGDPVHRAFEVPLRTIVGPLIVVLVALAGLHAIGRYRALRDALGAALLLLAEIGGLAIFVAVVVASLGHAPIVTPFSEAARWLVGLSWVFALLALPVGRFFLVEYVGDVAAYLSAHKVSRFDEIRKAIQKITIDVARAVYQAEDPHGFVYDQVIWVGHSLGTVVAYDTLNALINEDLILERSLRVVERTPAFLTVASPLNKTAYIFRSQRSDPLDVREGLASARQPLIVDYALRPLRWINHYSARDWIGGPLQYYDAPPADGASTGERHLWRQRHVRNRRDPWALTPLASHTEVFHGDRFSRSLYGVMAR